jgi:hypothetical protein
MCSADAISRRCVPVASWPVNGRIRGSDIGAFLATPDIYESVLRYHLSAPTRRKQSPPKIRDINAASRFPAARRRRPIG